MLDPAPTTEAEDDGYLTVYPSVWGGGQAVGGGANPDDEEEDCILRPGEMAVMRDCNDEPIWFLRGFRG